MDLIKCNSGDCTWYLNPAYIVKLRIITYGNKFHIEAYDTSEEKYTIGIYDNISDAYVKINEIFQTNNLLD